MRIVITSGPFIPFPPEASGAVEKVWHGLARQFVIRGHEVTLVGRATQAVAGETVENGVRYIFHQGYERTGSLAKDLILDLRFSWNLRHILPDADVIVTNSFFAPLVLRRWQRKGAKLVVHMARFPKFQTSFYLHADQIQVPSEVIRGKIVEQCPRASQLVKVVSYPVDTEVFFPKREPSSVPTVFFAGRVHPEKGVDLLASAVSQLEIPGLKLRVAGPVNIARGGGGKRYVDRIRAAAGRVNVEFLGNLADPVDLAREMSQATLFCYPSLAENGETFGVAPLEAMSTGTPTIVSGLECFQKHIIDQQTGLVFNHRANNRIELLAAKISKLLTQPELCERISQRGAEHGRNFGFSRIADLHLLDFQQLVTTGD